MQTLTMREAYRNLLLELFKYGTREINARTGVGITALPGGHSFKLDLSDGLLPIAGNRRYWPRIAAAEVAWQFLGTKDPEFILKHAPKLWSSFVENGELKSAYGYRWRNHFGRDQLGMAVAQLRDNPTNRQLYISAWDPSTDGLGAPGQPMNLPCPVGFSLTRVDNQIHCSVFIRSSDVFVGLPYDTMAYALTTAAVAASCGCSPGTLHITLAHPHYYHVHEEAIDTNLYGEEFFWLRDAEPCMPTWSVENIVRAPDGYVGTMANSAKCVPNPTWNPMPKLVI